MSLPIEPPFPPMECTQVERIPDGPQWEYEPKWDGFRCIAFRDGDDVYLQSKSAQPLARYFPEIVAQLRSIKATRFVLDGELMIERGTELDFDALLQRIHPAESRVKRLAKETPATYVVFDILVDAAGADVTGVPLRERRPILENFAKDYFAEGGMLLSPASIERTVVDEWYSHVGNALDGVVAKRADLPYASGTRSACFKIKHLRTADCVVGGYRLNKDKSGVGSLLLGLYDEEGLLNHVGFSSGFTTRERSPLLKQLREIEQPPGFTGNAPGGPSRWKDTEEPWFPLAPKLVVEVQYDHVTANRFRHGTKILRWRHDKVPRLCTMDQLYIAEVASPLELLTR
ncbi:MAG TPA: ATP-dependent DNA ligase [Candidatus Baltobacteraceae bacterium]|jgi:ATP-dependent DNA ligase|nr:ATP-dependent DNA ligase [Candidatus Baltobacteraceae bacterium]